MTQAQPDIVVPLALQHTQEATCSAPWFVCNTEYHPAMAAYLPLVNGEEAFRAVHQAIAAAKKTVDIICWGFQPSMYFIRDGSASSIGDLLRAKALEGVKVRVLGWEMPFNSAGFAGEANLPGKGSISIADRAGQSSTQQQYDDDRQWFADCAVADGKAAGRGNDKVPLFVSRGFSARERAEINHWVKRASLDPNISKKMRYTMGLSATHHQKSVLVDYELCDCAVGFVMGHNMLDEYWDTDSHSALNRSADSKPAPNRGARGDQPRQDISSQVSGPILEHLHHNFATAWLKETGEDLLVSRCSTEVAEHLTAGKGSLLVAQLLRTQAQAGKRDIEALYLKAINNATQFIYIENQYFRWPPLAEAIKQAAQVQTGAGRDPGLHGALHLFVITNATNDGMGAGTVKTQEMIESLGRAETIPAVTKLLRIKQIKKEMPPRPRPEPNDHVGQRELKEWQAQLDEQIKAVEDTTISPQEVPGLKVHLCSLVAPDSPAGKRWTPVYIHSKLMIVNDVFTTHGSANINTRSMMVDSELNIAHEWAEVTQALRRRLWNLHTKEMGAQDDPGKAFDAWEEILVENKKRQKDLKSGAPYASLIEFYYGEATLKDLD
ncbi:phosphatidylserine/phosphatidylglycerophosphate/cardiolipin synthase family protein [Pseudomonas sp. L13]|uniref:phospholipase D-like domain-containing protein n=1 Tax=Pseudomonas sp. L13 TaxID=343985 RepID=UPI001379B2FE|nr:phospholipase [Pseudomonas sp. L13]NCE94070.1 phospholipase [Pseudomonas sp. L13]